MAQQQVPEDIGCKNPDCVKKDECKRQVIAKDGTAREVKKFGGTPQKRVRQIYTKIASHLSCRFGGSSLFYYFQVKAATLTEMI